jgi:hypothetical protein
MQDILKLLEQVLKQQVQPQQQLALPNNAGILLLSASAEKKPKASKKSSFGVLVTDPTSSRFIVKELLKEINKYPKLKEQSKYFWAKKSVSKVKSGEVVIFGDAPTSFNYDYRIESDLSHEYSGKIRIYDLVQEFAEVKNALKNYYKANYPAKHGYEILSNCCITNTPKPVVRLPKPKVTVSVEVNIAAKPVKKEKKAKWQRVQVFHNYVKVGFDQFDILVDNKGKEYVIIDNELFRIKVDSCGSKYLQEE